MSKATIKRFLMLLSSARESERMQLYQLLQKAEYCYCLKDVRGQYEFGRALSLFSSPFDVVGDYYQSLYLHKTAQKQAAYEKLERVRHELKGGYADKATLMLSGIKEIDHNIDESMNLRLALTKSDSLPVVIESAIGVAAILSSQGEHQKALEQLEAVLPLIEKLGPSPLYFDVRNSYAVELAETGKIELASQVITPVAVSPYTLFYPNWIETEKEIKEKLGRRSMVTIGRSKVIDFPSKEKEEPEGVEETKVDEQPFPYNHYISEKFELQDKIEDWMCGVIEPNDFGSLMVAIAESRDEIERDMILEKIIDGTFPHTLQGIEAKERWREELLSKMKE